MATSAACLPHGIPQEGWTLDTGVIPVRFPAGSVEPGRDNPVFARLIELRCIEDGWLDGAGQAPQEVVLDWCAERLGSNLDLPVPHLYPTAEGGVQAEWTFGVHEASLEVSCEGNIIKGEWHCLDMVTDEDESRDLDLDREWDWLAGKIANLAKSCR
ncbi:MAG: hypothetical protein H7833_18540 [Magnetococcus sp. DMHC-1]